MSSTNGLSTKAGKSQHFSDLQVKLLTIIFEQIRSHERTTAFDLGSTRRTHTFERDQTYVAASKWANMLETSSKTVRRYLSQLAELNTINITRQKNWSVVELISFHRDESKKCSTENVPLTAANVPLNVPLTDTQKTVVKRDCPTECPTASQYKLDITLKDLKNTNEHSNALGHVPLNLFDRSELREEKIDEPQRRRCIVTADDLLSNPAYKNFRVKNLVAINNRLAELPKHVLLHKPRKNSIARRCWSKWRQMCNPRSFRHRGLVEWLEHEDEIFAAIDRAVVAHSTRWFRLEWLLSFEMPNQRSEDMHGLLNVEKLLDGKYEIMTPFLEEQRHREKISSSPTTYETVGEGFFDDV